MQRFHTNPSLLGSAYPVIGKNSEVNSVADAQYVDSSGFLAVITTSSKVFGFSQEDSTNTSDNQTVAKKKPLCVPALGILMEYTADQAVTQTDLDQYVDMGTVTSGAQVLNFAAGSSGQFKAVGFDPNNDGTTTLAVVEVAEPQYLAFAQA